MSPSILRSLRRFHSGLAVICVSVHRDYKAWTINGLDYTMDSRDIAELRGINPPAMASK